MAEKKEYKEFQRLLIKGIAGRKQQTVADICGLSGAHLNRMLNQRFIGKPSKMTLSKLAKGMEGVTLAELYASCGYTDEAAIMTKDDSELNEYQKRLKLPIKDRITLNKKDMKIGFKDLCNVKMGVYPSLQALFGQMDMLDAVEHVTYTVRSTGHYFGSKHQNAENYAVVDIFCDFGSITMTMIMVLFYCETTGGKLIFTDAAFDGASLLEVNALTKEELAEFKHYGVSIALLPDVAITHEKSKKELKTKAAKELLNNIFGMGEPLNSVVEGFGFYLHDCPIHFREFLKNHASSFQETDEEIQLYQRVVDGQESPEIVFENYKDSDTWESGFGAVISHIMSREQSIAFEFYQDDTHGFENNLPCVMYVGHDVDARKLEDIVYQYAKELGVPYIQECYFQTVTYRDTNSIIKVE